MFIPESHRGRDLTRRESRRRGDRAVRCRVVLIVGLLAAPILFGTSLAQSPRASLQLEVTARSASESTVVRLREGDELSSSDGLRVELLTDADAYVYVLALGSSGRLQLLQPFSREDHAAFQNAGEPRALPGGGGFLSLDDTPGPETLFAFAASKPISNLGDWLARVSVSVTRERIEERLAIEFPGTQVLGFRHRSESGAAVASAPRAEPVPPARSGPIPAPAPSDIFANSDTEAELGVLEGSGSKIDALLGGSRPAAPAAIPPMSAVSSPSDGAAIGSDRVEDAGDQKSPGVLGRIGGWFRRDEPTDVDRSAASEPLPPPRDPPPPDTLTVLIPVNQHVIVRLAEIDTPEKGQPFASKSKQALSGLVFGNTVTIIPIDTDRYGRTIARVVVDGVDVNKDMVRRGYAWVYREYVRDQSLIHYRGRSPVGTTRDLGSAGNR